MTFYLVKTIILWLRSLSLRNKIKNQKLANELLQQEKEYSAIQIEKDRIEDSARREQEFEQVKAEIELHRAKKRPTSEHFQLERGYRSKEDALRNVENIAEGHRVSNEYAYCRVLHSAASSFRDGVHTWYRGSCYAIFSDDPLEVYDPNDKVIETFVKECIESMPSLLVHPDEKIRRIAQEVKESTE